jgi:hypothetical protein
MATYKQVREDMLHNADFFFVRSATKVFFEKERKKNARNLGRK